MSNDETENSPLFKVEIVYPSINCNKHLVQLYGSWDGFEANQNLEYCEQQIYASTIKLPIGIYRYRFLIDNKKWDINFFQRKVIINGIQYNHIQINADHETNDTVHQQQLHSKYDKCSQQKQTQWQQYKLSMHEIETFFNNDANVYYHRKRNILLMSAYIRNIEHIHNIIPQSIVILCFRFFHYDDQCRINLFCRIRPLLAFELRKNYTNIIQIDETEDNKLSLVDDRDREHSFNYFNKLYTDHCTQHDIFNDTASHLEELLYGGNVSIFVYGQTGSGKTHTMQGTEDDAGIMFRSVQYVLDKVVVHESNTLQYTIKCAIIEIYNERICDLLHNIGLKKKQKKKRKLIEPRVKHQLYDDPHITDLKWVTIESMDDFQSAHKLARRNKCTQTTNMGAYSSRSHDLWLLKIVGRDTVNDIEYYARLNFIECAGSERIKKSGATGMRLKEAANINKSLSALGDVLSALNDEAKFIPYRNSTLTDMLVGSFGEKQLNSRVMFYLNIIPSQWRVFETVYTLRFGQRVSKQGALLRQKRPKKRKKRTSPQQK